MAYCNAACRGGVNLARAHRVRGGASDKVKIAFAQSEITIDVGKTQLVGLTVEGTTDTPAIEVDNKSVATVSVQPSGIQIKGIAQGEATVTAKVGGAVATCKVTVVRPEQEDGVAWADSALSFAKGVTEGYNAKFTFTAKTEGAKPTVSLDDSDRFTVGEVVLGATEGEATVKITPKADAAYGESTVTLTMGTQTARIPVEICSPGILLDEESISPTGVTMVGLSAAFTDGKLYVPRTIYEEGMGRYVPVKKIGNGKAPITLAAEAAAITEVHTGEGVELIAEYAFDGIGTFTLLTVGSKVKEIGVGAFRVEEEPYSQLRDIVFSENSSLRKIGGVAFQRCAIVEIELPEGLEEIGGQAFIWCTSLEKATVPSTYKPVSDTEGGIGTFWDCNALKEVTLPVLEFISTSMFNGVPTLEKVNFAGTREQFRAMEKTTRETIDSGYVAEAVFKCENIVCSDGVLPVVLEIETLSRNTLNIGSTLTLTVSGKNLDDTITFVSGNEAAATVVKTSATATEATATVTGVAVGTATITVSCGDVTDTASITVVDPNVDFVSILENITNEEDYYVVGKDDGAQTFNLTYTVKTDGTEPTITVTEGADVVEVGAIVDGADNDGILSATFTLTAQTYGTAVVTVAVGTASETFTVEVCSSGLVFDCNATGAASLTAVTGAFPGGELHIPSYVVENGKRYTVTQLGVGQTISIPKPVTDLYTGDNTIWIYKSAFEEAQIETLHVGKSVAKIWDAAFWYATVSAIEFAENGALTEIGVQAFNGYKGTTLVLPEGLTTLGETAFYDATELQTLTVPSTLAAGKLAFQVGDAKNSKLTAVMLGKLARLPEGFFMNRAGMEKIEFAGTKAEWQALLAATDLSMQGNINDTEVQCSDGTILPVRMAFTAESGSVSVGASITITVSGQALENVVFTANPADAVTITMGTDNTTESVSATVTGVTAGVVTITATCGTKTDTYTLTVVGAETQLNKIGANVNIPVTDAAIEAGTATFDYTFTYKPSQAGTTPTAEYLVLDNKTCLELGDITTVSTDESTGLITARLTIKVVALGSGRGNVKISLEGKDFTTTFYPGSAGITYTLHDQANKQLTVTGVGEGFGGGALIVPRRLVIDGVDWTPAIVGEGWNGDGGEKTIANTSGKDITAFIDMGGCSVIKPYAFYNMKSLKKATFDEYALQIWEYAFRDSGIEEIDLSNATRLQTIGAGCFISAPLKKIDFSAVGTELNIGAQSFFWANNLTEVTMPKTVKMDGENSKYGLQGSALTTVRFVEGSTYDFIRDNFFAGQDNITDVYFAGTQEQWNLLKGASDIVSNGTLFTTATVHCSDGDLVQTVFMVNPSHGTTCYNAANVNEAYSWDFTPLNLFICSDENVTLEYEVKLNGVTITERSTNPVVSHTFTATGNIEITVYCYKGADDTVGISTTVTVVVGVPEA